MRKFLDDRKGAFAMQFALLVVPLTVCTGLAIDGGRAFLARYELASALDAAALAVGSTTTEGSDLNAIAHKFVNANFHTPHEGEISLLLIPGDDEDDTVQLRGNVTISTYFMPLIGQPTVNIGAESTVKRGGANVEVVLALDVTGSMEEDGGGGETRIEGLRSAANLLINKVVNPIQTPYFSKVAVVPWSQSVHVDDTHVNAAALEELRGEIIGSTSITSANWRKTATSTKTINEAGWRTVATAGGKGISGVSWRNGSPLNITSIAMATGTPNRILVTTSSNHGYTTGETVYFSGITNGSYQYLNGHRYTVRTTTNAAQFRLYQLGTTTYEPPPSGTLTNSTSITNGVQRCWDTACNVGITTSSAHTLSANDFAHITGVQGFTTVNNTDTTTWVVAGVPNTTTYTIPMFGPSAVQTYTTSSGDRSSECYVSDCRYRVTTSANHGFLTSDHIFIWGMTQSGSGTSAVTAANTTWTGTHSIDSPAGAVFFLPGKGVDYQDWSSGGSAAQCALATCNIEINSAGHGIAAGEHIRIESATGLTGVNNCPIDTDDGSCDSGSRMVWAVSTVSGDVLTLQDSSPALSNMSGAYGSSGTLQCTRYGCNRLWFKNSSNNDRLYRPTQCIVERYGADAYKDTDPSDAPLGIYYSDNGSCLTANYVTPLTSNKARLTTAIEDLDTDGSTAGQIGVGWGWYMLSENFDGIWDDEPENQPKSYTANELAKVLVLMTDGEFNYATCSGVTSSSISTSICVPDDAGDAAPSKHRAFKQAEAMCAAIREKGIIIYTVGMQLDTAQYGDEFLTNCVGTTGKAYLAASNEQLEDAFKDIAKEIAKLRIAH